MSNVSSDEPVVVPPLPVAVQLTSDVKDLVRQKEGEGVVRSRVVEHLAEEELVRRKDLLLKGLTARKTAEQVLRKIKPDVEYYGEDGKPTGSHFSKAKAEELKKAKELLTRIDKAIADAVNEANYDGLKKVTQQGAPDEKEKTE